MSKKPKPAPPAGKLAADKFLLWVTLPKVRRADVRAAAGSLDLTMSEFARRAVLDAVARVQSGERPFTEETTR